jgi:hypothetical protein
MRWLLAPYSEEQILIATLLVAYALARFERRLVWSLLGAPMPALPPRRDEATGLRWCGYSIGISANRREMSTPRLRWIALATK